MLLGPRQFLGPSGISEARRCFGNWCCALVISSSGIYAAYMVGCEIDVAMRTGRATYARRSTLHWELVLGHIRGVYGRLWNRHIRGGWAREARRCSGNWCFPAGKQPRKKHKKRATPKGRPVSQCLCNRHQYVFRAVDGARAAFVAFVVFGIRFACVMIRATRAAKSGIVGAAILRFNCSYDAFQCDRCVHGFDPLNKLGRPDYSGLPSVAMYRLVLATAMLAVNGNQGIA